MSSSQEASVGAAQSDVPPIPGESLAELADASRQQAGERVRMAEHVDAPPVTLGNALKATEGLRNQHLLLTYAQCEAPLSFLFDVLGHSRVVLGLAAVRETHRDGGHHLHCYMQKKRALLSWDAVTFMWLGKSHRPNVRTLTTGKHRRNAFEYLFKEGTVEYHREFTEPPVPRASSGRPSSSQELLEVASSSSIDVALAQYVSEGGDLSRVGPVQRGLQVLLAGPPPAPRWDPTPPEIVLRPWQTLLLSFLNSRPERRRIFWVYGEPGSGKTTFSSWLEQPSNYEGGVVNLGCCENTVNALHNYHSEAVVCLDYPRSFDWARKAEAVSMLCETFSEFGASRQSTKYVGRRVSICCHLVVFSNRLPIDEVRHREVYLIETSESSQSSTIAMAPRPDRGSPGARSRSRSPVL